MSICSPPGDRDLTGKALIVKVTDCEYQSFIANVEWFVGARWPEVGHDSGR